MDTLSTAHNRVLNSDLRQRIMSADDAAALIHNGDNIGMSGFTGSGYPKEFPPALARRMDKDREAGNPLRVGVFTGASTGPELDGALAAANGMQVRLPYQSDPAVRKRINDGDMEYGYLGKLNMAVIEVAAIYEDGRAIPSTSLGNNKSWLECADRVILEVNSWQSIDLEGMHDVYYGLDVPPRREPIPITRSGQRIGSPYLNIPLEKVVAVIETHSPDRNTAFKEPDKASLQIAGHILEFLDWEVKKGRMPADLLPIQSGVGNIANAVLFGLNQGNFHNLTAYTEVIQDGMIELIKSGKMISASATSFSLGPEMIKEVYGNLRDYRRSIVLRTQDISNNPGIIRRFGVISMNGMMEADLYGNVNSTHIMGSKIMNGIGGSGDFARNAYLSIFMAPSTAAKGTISTIVPMVSHVDHTEHDTQVLVTERGLADLRGLSPKQRARLVIEKCASEEFKPLLKDYFERAQKNGTGMHTPHILSEAHGFHERYLKTGKMLP